MQQIYTIDQRINSFDLYVDKNFLGVGRTLGGGGIECCKGKQVPRMCLGYCIKDDGNVESMARSMACNEFTEVAEKCMNGNQFYIHT